MLLTDCPLCDRTATLWATTGDLDCEACGVHLELAPDEQPVDLGLAA